MNTLEALRLTEALLGMSLVVQTLEHVWTRRALGPNGVWDWAVVRDEFAALPAAARAILDALLGPLGFGVVLGLRAAAALALIAWGGLLPACFASVTTVLVCLRFRGLFNGGSDYMTVHVGLALAVSHAASGAPTWVDGALGWIALQTLLSYGVAGAVKVRSSAWLDGTALAGFVGSDRYAAPAALRACVARPGMARAASLAVIAFELSAPAVLLLPSRAAVVAWLGAALCFHVVNAWALGLNRFVFAWLAAYPAVLFWATRLGAR
jgi:hypothetical protein